MSYIRFVAPIGLAILPLLATLSSAESFECPVIRNDNYRTGNEAPEVGVPEDGKVVFGPVGPGFIAISDGALPETSRALGEYNDALQ